MSNFLKNFLKTFCVHFDATTCRCISAKSICYCRHLKQSLIPWMMLHWTSWLVSIHQLPNAMQRIATNPQIVELKDCYDYDAMCPHDSLHFKSAEEWKRHHADHHMDTKWKCPLCGIQSSTWHNYSYHVQTAMHKTKCPPPWICKLERFPSLFHLENRCGVRFGSKYQIIRHIRSSHPNYKVILCFCSTAHYFLN